LLEFSSKLGNKIFRNFHDGGLVLILLELKRLDLPAIVAYNLRYLVSCIYLTSTFIALGWPHVCGYATGLRNW